MLKQNRKIWIGICLLFVGILNANAVEQQVLRLMVSNGINSDEAIIVFNASASNGYDIYDSPKMSNDNVLIPEIYSISGTEKLVINGLNSIEANKELILGFKTGQANTFTLKSSGMTNFSSDVKILLRDNLMNVTFDLSNSAVYTFTSAIATTTTRFSVLFAKTASEIAWSGTGTWNTPANWSTGYVPALGSNIVVVSGELSIDRTMTVGNLTVNPGADLTLAAGNVLTVNGNFVLKSDSANGVGTFVDNGTTNVAGSTSVEQFITGNGGATPNGRGWYISSPFSNGNSGVYAASGGNHLWEYSETSNGYSKITNDTTSLLPMRGYYAKVGTNGIVTFTGGSLNNGEISNLNLSRTGSTNAKRGYHLIGNPYPSVLDWSAALKTNIRTTMWFRTLSYSSAMVFDSYNVLGGIGTNNNGRGAVNQYIPPMQAFWIRVDGDGNTGSITFNNSMRSHLSGNGRLLRQANAPQQVLRLKVSNRTNSDETIVLFDPNASDDYDDFDSPKMSNSNDSIPEIATFSGSEPLVINGLNSIGTGKELILAFKSGQKATCSIQATEIQNFDSDVNIVLKDNLLRQTQELAIGTSYSFTTDVTNNSNRFSLVFTKAATGIEKTPANPKFSVFQKVDGSVLVRLDGDIQGTITLFNALGQRLYSSISTGKETVLETTLSPGIYLVSMVVNGQKGTKKMLVK